MDVEDSTVTDEGRPWPRIFAGLGAVLAMIAVLIIAPVEMWVVATADWIDGAGPLGVLIFGLIYVVGTVLFIPASVLSICAGFLFGLTGGAALVAFTVPLGAVLAFWISRYLGRKQVQKKVVDLPKFNAMERAISHEGFKMAFLIRFVPLFPFTMVNYLFGVTRVGVRRFAAATWLGMLPTTVGYVYVGAIAGDLKRALIMDEAPGPATYIIWASGALAVVVIVLLMTRRARQELEFIMSQDDSDN